MYIYIYIKPLKSEAIHETGLSGNVVASLFPSHNIFIYIHCSITTVQNDWSKISQLIHQSHLRKL